MFSVLGGLVFMGAGLLMCVLLRRQGMLHTKAHHRLHDSSEEMEEHEFRHASGTAAPVAVPLDMPAREHMRARHAAASMPQVTAVPVRPSSPPRQRLPPLFPSASAPLLSPPPASSFPVRARARVMPLGRV